MLPAKGGIDAAEWLKCKTIGRIDSVRWVGDRESALEQRYYISSRELSAEDLAIAVRSHWAIENRLRWVLDGSFGEDGSTIRKDNAPQNLSLLKKIVFNSLRSDTTQTAKAGGLPGLPRAELSTDDRTRGGLHRRLPHLGVATHLSELLLRLHGPGGSEIVSQSQGKCSRGSWINHRRAVFHTTCVIQSVRRVFQ